MKKNNNHKRGISLIVLIITIIVVIILAAAVILTLNNNNPITSAKEATFKSDMATIQDELSLYLSNEYKKDPNGFDKSKINLTSDDMLAKLPSTEKYKDRLEVIGGTLNYIYVDEKYAEEKEWAAATGITVEEAFDADEWDKTATSQDCFLWGSNTPGEDGYDVIIGYTSNLQNYPKVRIPSRCKRIICDGTYHDQNDKYSDSTIGRAFLSNITSIEVPGTTEEIGAYAFGGVNQLVASSLTDITILNGVKTIGYCAFWGASNLKSIKLPSSITTIGGAAFYDCTLLNSINIPNSVTSIGAHTFYNCKGLTNIIIPSKVTRIESSTFSKCTGLTSITIPSSVINMDDLIFEGCSNLTTINCKVASQPSTWNSNWKGNCNATVNWGV